LEKEITTDLIDRSPTSFFVGWIKTSVRKIEILFKEFIGPKILKNT
jgi:hypothetical protein